METVQDIRLVGPDRRVSFPNYCANCNDPAHGRLPVQRIFTRYSANTGSGTGGAFKIVTSFKVPFCRTCIELHKKEEEPLTWWNWLKAFLLGGMPIVPAIYIFFLSLNSWRDFLQGLVEGDLFTIVLYGVLSVLSLGVVAMLFLGARFLSRPHLVVPPTSVTSAIDFSDGQKSRVFKFQNQNYAERFREANRKRLWSPGQSRVGIPWRWIFRLLLLAALAAVTWWLWTQGIF